MAEKKEIEALKTALLLEKQGKMFYQRVAKDTESRAVTSLFEIMAKRKPSILSTYPNSSPTTPPLAPSWNKNRRKPPSLRCGRFCPKRFANR